MRSINAGELRNRVDLQSDTITLTKGVQSKTSETYAYEVYAKVEALTGREFWQAQQVNSELRWKVTTRYRTDLRAQHRIIYGDRRLEILAIQPDEIYKELVVLMCRELN